MIRKKKNECPTCGKVYMLLCSLKTHLLSHANDNSYTCSECLRTFLTEKQLKEHTLSHAKNNSIDIELIDSKQLKQISMNELHLKDPAGDSLRGDQTGSNLKELVRIYQNLLKCPRCPMTFIRKVELESHLSTHSYDGKICDEFCATLNSAGFADEKANKLQDVICHSVCNDVDLPRKLLDKSATVNTLSNNVGGDFHKEAENQNAKKVDYLGNRSRRKAAHNPKLGPSSFASVSCQDSQLALHSRKPVRYSETLTKKEFEFSSFPGIKDQFVKDTPSEVEDRREGYDSNIKCSLANGLDTATEHHEKSAKAPELRDSECLQETEDRSLYFENNILSLMSFDNEIPQKSSGRDVNNMSMSVSPIISNVPYLIENKLTVGNDGALNILEADVSEDYCMLFKCLMCPMIFLVKEGIDSHLHLHMNEIRNGSKVSKECKKSSEKVGLSKQDSQSSVLERENPSVDVKLMGNIYRIRLRRVYQRYYKCIQCPMVFLTKTEVQNHMVTVHACESIVDEMHSDEKTDVRDYEHLSGSVDALGGRNQLEDHETAPSSVYCPIFQCLKCEITFMTKAEFKSHSSLHKSEVSSCLAVGSETLASRKSDELSGEAHGNPGSFGISSFSCCSCDKKFSSRKKLIDHKRIHGIKKLECKECGKKFRANSYLKKHMKVHSRPYKCTKCSKTFKSDYVLELHQAMHSNARPYECTKCGNVFRNKISLTLHSYDHLTNGPFSCEICKNIFSTSQLLKDHLKTHLKETWEEEKSFLCPKCNKVYSDKKKFQHHIHSHTRSVSYRCKYCHKIFPNRNLLAQHRRAHNKDRPFQCPVCQKRFSVRNSLLNHLDIHSSDKQYLCHICGISLNQRSSYYSHVKKHAGVRHHHCSICEKTFLYRGSYRRHMMSLHFGKKPFQCLSCGKTFKQSAHLKSHMVVHTGEKPYQCRICDKSFTQKGSLKIHQLTHNDGQYACSECGRKFTQKNTLLNHRKNKLRGKSFWCKVCRMLFTRRACLIHHRRTHLRKTLVINVDGVKDSVENFIDDNDEYKEIIITQASLCGLEEEVVETHAVPFDSHENQMINSVLERNDAVPSIQVQVLAFNPQESRPLTLDASETFNLDPREIEAFVFNSPQETPTLTLEPGGSERILDYVSDAVQTPRFVPGTTSPVNLSPSEAHMFALNSSESHHAFTFDVKDTVAFDIPGEGGPLDFSDHEEITVTPVDRGEGDSEPVQIHFIF